MVKYLYKHRRLFLVCLATFAFMLTVYLNFSAWAQTEGVKSYLDPIPAKQQVNLKEGQVIVTGSEGQYTGRLLVEAPLITAWAVLTDYDNFARFLPHISKSQLLESNGNRKVFEQVNIAKVFLFTKKARVRIEATETYPQQIAFRVIEGDVKSLQGVWQFEALSNQVLIDHQVSVDPGSENRNLFFKIYKNNLEDTLEALIKEIKRRSLTR